MQWFKHDIDAHDDIKIKKLLKRNGFSALGVYWFLVELLFSNDGRIDYAVAIDEITLVDGLDERTAQDFVDLFLSLGLMYSEGSFIGSHRADAELENDRALKQKYSNMGKASAEARFNASSTDVQHRFNVGSTDDERAFNRLDKIRRDKNNNPPILPNGNNPPTGDSPTEKKKRFVQPSVQDIEEYGQRSGYVIDAAAFIDHYKSVGWMVGKHRMKDWESAVRNWARRDRLEKTPPEEKKAPVDDGFTPEQLAEIRRQEEEALEIWRKDHADK